MFLITRPSFKKTKTKQKTPHQEPQSTETLHIPEISFPSFHLKVNRVVNSPQGRSGKLGSTGQSCHKGKSTCAVYTDGGMSWEPSQTPALPQMLLLDDIRLSCGGEHGLPLARTLQVQASLLFVRTWERKNVQYCTQFQTCTWGGGGVPTFL